MTSQRARVACIILTQSVAAQGRCLAEAPMRIWRWSGVASEDSEVKRLSRVDNEIVVYEYSVESLRQGMMETFNR